jgi:hypothetical protein
MPISAADFAGAVIALSLTLFSPHYQADRYSRRDTAHEKCSSGFAGMKLQTFLCVIEKFIRCTRATFCSALSYYHAIFKYAPNC